LLVAYRFQPNNVFPIDHFLNGDMGYRTVRRSAVPVLDAGGNPHHVTGLHGQNRAVPLLDEAAPGGDDKDLTQGVRVPGGAGTGLKGYHTTSETTRAAGGK
jgi:hypothetical protein